MEHNVNKAIRKEEAKVNKVLKRKVITKRGDQNKIVISGPDKSLNHYLGQEYSKDNIPLISKEWIGSQTNGNAFVCCASMI